ncbi:LexA/Signal peptidase [Hymenopellis radicata]|nr:LexA/Signal peptidase [Hymenopellis radicata]
MQRFPYLFRFPKGTFSIRKTATTSARLLFAVANVFCVTHLLFDYVGRPAMTDGPSMLPTLAARGDCIIEDRLSVRRDPVTFSRGEIVTLKSPLDPLRIVCKRIIGLPGDIICVDPTGQYAHSSEHIVVPRGHVWVAGDNLPYSRDSRMYGPVPMGLIQGRAVLKFSPDLLNYATFKTAFKGL